MSDESMESLYNQLCHQLAKAKYPQDWWHEMHEAIDTLHTHSPRLFAELVIRFRDRGGQSSAR